MKNFLLKFDNKQQALDELTDCVNTDDEGNISWVNHILETKAITQNMEVDLEGEITQPEEYLSGYYLISQCPEMNGHKEYCIDNVNALRLSPIWSGMDTTEFIKDK